MSDYIDEQRTLDVFLDEGCPNPNEGSQKQTDPARSASEAKSKRMQWTLLQSPVRRIALLALTMAIAAAPIPLQLEAPNSVDISSLIGAAS